jgi:hypothetical protein
MRARDSGEDKALRNAGFRLAWRGYSRADVQDYVRRAEAGLRLVAADRDDAASRAEALAGQADALISENNWLRSVIDRISQSPIDPDALQERSRRMVELVREEAAEITRAAQAAAEQADQRRVVLDQESARRRRDTEHDFAAAMAAQRAQALRGIAELEAAAKAAAETLVSKATEEARRLVTGAERQVKVVNAVSARVASEVKSCRELLATCLPELAVPLEKPVSLEKPAPTKSTSHREATFLVPRQRGGTPVISE